MELLSKVFRIHFGSRPLPCNDEVSDGIEGGIEALETKESGTCHRAQAKVVPKESG